MKERLQGLGVVFSLLASVYAGYTVVGAKIDNVATDEELKVHDSNDRAHPPIRAQIEECKTYADSLSKELDDEHKSTIAIGVHLVRLIAADREPNRNLRAAAATYYEQEFRHLVNNGTKIEDAMLMALRTPWLTRPRGM